MKATILLADCAQAVEGKLYILGGGWSVTGPGPTPSAIPLKLEVPLDRANHKYHLRLELLDSDGQPVAVPAPDGEEHAVQIKAVFEAGGPAGLIPGTPLDGAFAINLGPLPLTPGARYAWRLTVDVRPTRTGRWASAFASFLLEQRRGARLVAVEKTAKSDT